MSIYGVNYADMFNQNYQNAYKSYDGLNYTKPQTTQTTQSDTISFKSNPEKTNVQSQEKPKEEKKSGSTLKGIAIGAAIAGVAAWFLTRGKVKPSAIKPLTVQKAEKLAYKTDFEGYANAISKGYGKSADKVHFIKGNKYAEFIKNNKEYAGINSLKEYGQLTEQEIIAVASKDGNPIAGTEMIFSSPKFDDEIIKAFGSEPMHVISFV